MSYDDWKATDPTDYADDNQDDTTEEYTALWRERLAQEVE